MSTTKDELQTPTDFEQWEATSRFENRHASFKWKIENFSLCLFEESKEIQSQSFDCSDSTWALDLYPNGEDSDSAGFISIYLTKLSPVTEKSTSCKICLKDKYGIDHYARKMDALFSAEDDSSWGWKLFVERKALLGEKRSKLLHGDVLTVYCELTVKDNIVHGDTERIFRRHSEKGDDAETYSVPKGIEILVDDMEAVLNERKNCDLALEVDDEKFPVHKLLLGARSNVFAGLLENGMDENRSVLTMTGIQTTVVNDLLRYIYCGRLSDMSVEKAKGLYIAADKYALLELKMQCTDFLQNNLSMDNVCDVVVFADAQNDVKIIDTIKNFVRKNMSILSTEKWARLAMEKPRLSSDIILSLSLDLSPEA